MTIEFCIKTKIRYPRRVGPQSCETFLDYTVSYGPNGDRSQTGWGNYLRVVPTKTKILGETRKVVKYRTVNGKALFSVEVLS